MNQPARLTSLLVLSVATQLHRAAEATEATAAAPTPEPAVNAGALWRDTCAVMSAHPAQARGARLFAALQAAAQEPAARVSYS